MKRLVLFSALCLPALAMPSWAQSGNSVTGRATRVVGSAAPGQGAPIVTVPFAKVAVYSLGTSNLAPMFSDANMTVPVSNPYSADGSGVYGFYLAPGQYTYTITSSAGQPISSGNITAGGSGGTATLTQAAIASVGTLLNDTLGTSGNTTKVNGNAIPAAAGCVSTDAGGHLVAGCTGTGTSVTLQTNGIANATQNKLNLQQNSGISISNDANGNTTIGADVQSVNGQKGNPVLDYNAVGADPAGAAAAAQAAAQAFSSDATNITQNLVNNARLCNGTPGANTYCDPISRNWLVLPGSSGSAGTGTINNATAFSPAYYPSTGTTIGGTAPFNGLGYWSTSAAPRAAVSADLNPLLATPGPIGFTTPNMARISGDTNATPSFFQMFTVPSPPGAGGALASGAFQPGSTGLVAGLLCGGRWVASGTGTWRATATCDDNVGTHTWWTAGAAALGSESWTLRGTLNNTGVFTSQQLAANTFGSFKGARTAAANQATVQYVAGSGYFGANGASSSLYGNVVLVSETSAGTAGDLFTCGGAVGAFGCTNNGFVSATQFINPITTITSSATPAIAANNGLQRITLSANATPTISGIAAGQHVVFQICQPSTGGPYTWTWPSAVQGGIPSSTIGAMANSTCAVQAFDSFSGSTLVAESYGSVGVAP